MEYKIKNGKNSKKIKEKIERKIELKIENKKLENEIILETSQGIMLVSGEDMRIEKLSIEAGDAVIEGHIISIEYSEKDRRKENFWSRMF
mgnify:CR=1 FL=1